jgi:hypothetical protein
MYFTTTNSHSVSTEVEEASPTVAPRGMQEKPEAIDLAGVNGQFKP